MHHRRFAVAKWEGEENEPWWDLVMQSGLAHLRSCMHEHIDVPLISAFVERWQAEPNAFHMPWGEMSIALHDVWFILRLKIDGDSVELNQKDRKKTPTQVKEELAKFLVYDVDDLNEEMAKASIKFETLKNAGELLQEPEDRAAAYLLYLISGTLFADKSVDRARHRFLPVVRGVQKVSDYSFGSAVLADLYRRLGEASRADCKQMCGCLTLLQVIVIMLCY